MPIFRSQNLEADIAAYLNYEAEQELRAPKCSICGEPIYQEDAVRLDGAWICDDCLHAMREFIE